MAPVSAARPFSRAGVRLVLVALVVGVAALGCSSSSASPTGSSGGFTCQNPASPGPDSEGCAACGAAQCPSEESAVTSSCASLVSCIVDCQCGDGTCEDHCILAASAGCQSLITSLGDRQKQTAACAADCNEG